MMFDPALSAKAEELLAICRRQHLRLATAESCTGGLVAAVITSIAGASDVLDTGLVTYSNNAKTGLLGVPVQLIEAHGAVSEETARAMAEGVVNAREVQLGLAVTGIAGPAGGSAVKPVGLVHIAAARWGLPTLHKKLMLGDVGREEIRLRSVGEVLALGLNQAAMGAP